MSDPTNTTARNPESESALDDTLARTRALPVTPPHSIPRVPETYRSTEPEMRNKRMRRMPGHLNQESLAALETLGGRGAQLRQDLGEFVPEPSMAMKLVQDIKEVNASRAAAQALLGYLTEKQDLLLSDAMVLLEQAHKEYEHRVTRKPHLALDYKLLADFIAARNKAISEGIARAKKEGKPVE